MAAKGAKAKGGKEYGRKNRKAEGKALRHAAKQALKAEAPMCTECQTPCELHRITYCATCHNHPGECEYGGCFKPAATRWDFGHEVRAFCRKHSEAPHYGWLRKGAKVLGPVGR